MRYTSTAIPAICSATEIRVGDGFHFHGVLSSSQSCPCFSARAIAFAAARKRLATSFKLAGYVFLRAWVQLAVQNAGRNRFQIKPKHHLLEHGLNLAFTTLRNARSNWLYRHESFVGTTARIAARTHVSTATMRTLQRWMLTWHVTTPHPELKPQRGVKRKHHRPTWRRARG